MVMTESLPDVATSAVEKPKRGPSIFIGNIPYDVPEDVIKSQVAGKIGSFTSFVLVKDKITGTSKGFGYLNFEDGQEAELPGKVQSLTGLEINGNALKVEVFEKKEPKLRTAGSAAAKKPFAPRIYEKRSEGMSVYIGNLAYTVTPDELQTFVAQFVDPANIKNVRMALDKETGKCRGFGHVEFNSKESCDAAIAALNGQELAGRSVRVNAADSKEEQDKAASLARSTGLRSPNTLYLGNLAWSVDEDLIKEMLSDLIGANSFKTVRLARDKQTNRTRGFAHVEFVDQATLEKAVTELNGLEVMNRPLQAAKADKSGDK